MVSNNKNLPEKIRERKTKLKIDKKMKKKKYSEFQKRRDRQLDFFHFLTPRDQEFSNTLHLYDALPKYTVSPLALRRVESKYLDSKHSSLSYRGKSYKVTVFPARVEDWRDGVEKDFLPGKNEEIVEDVIRKISLDHRSLGKYVDEHYSVVFSNKEVLGYLKEAGHTMSLRQFKHSLDILSRCTLLVETEGERTALLQSPLFPVVGDDAENVEGCENFVIFNPLVTHEIKKGSFHLLHLKKCLGLKQFLARWLFKRLSQRYFQADFRTSFGPINYSTIQRESGCEEYGRAYMGIKNLEKALEELKKAKVIVRYDKEIMLERRKVTDAAFRLWPHPEFVKDMKYSNKRYSRMEVSAQISRLDGADPDNGTKEDT